MEPVPPKPESVPPETVTPVWVKVEEFSLSVNVIVAVWPMPRVVLSLVIATVGTTVSIGSVRRIDARLALPAASVNLPAATDICPDAVELAVGVKMAVYTDPEPLRLESVPPETVTSPSTKVVEFSLSVNVIVAVSPALSEALLLAIAMVGTMVSIAIGAGSVAA